MNRDAVVGCLLGTAVGDALGLPYEGLPARRASRLFPDTARHHLLFGRGMVSDDTEHACFTTQALIDAGDDVEIFRQRLARSLRWWLAGLPAGVGFATLRAILKLWLGTGPEKSGVYSAGNGPAMRSPIIGVVLGHDRDRLRAFVRASTGITHRDPKAYYAALAVALAAHQAAGDERPTAAGFLASLGILLPDANAEAAEFHWLLKRAADSAVRAEPLAAFAESIGSSKGISGYGFHTVPCVLQQWFLDPDDFEGGLQAIIRAGGDTDTAGAIFGGIVGARVGREGIPSRWLGKIVEWPRSTKWIERLGEALAAGEPAPRYFVPAVPLRNLVFLAAVLAHGLRRLGPPY